jgi:hypothetical protein
MEAHSLSYAGNGLAALHDWLAKALLAGAIPEIH